MFKKLTDTRLKKIIVALAAVYAISLLLFLFIRYRSYSKLKVGTNVPARVLVGGKSGNSGEEFVVSPGRVSVLARAAGYCDAAATIKLERRATRTVRLNLAQVPVPVSVPGGEYCAYPAFNAASGLLYWLGCRGSSFVSMDPTGNERILNDKRLAQITSVIWSPDGSTAIIRVEPEGDVLSSLGSPLASSSPSSFIYRAAENRFYPIGVDYASGASFDESGKLVFYGGMEGKKSVLFISPADSIDPSTGGVDTGKAAKIVLKAELMFPYTWASPDGSKVAFTPTPTEDMSACDLFFMDFGRKISRALTDGGNVYCCLWSPDSRYLVFESRDPISQVPRLLAYDTRALKLTPLSLYTYVQKAAFYSSRTLLAGVPLNVEAALSSGDTTTPDSLVYCSAATGARATILSAEEGSQEHFTYPVISSDRSTLYYAGALFLKKLDLSGLKRSIKDFEGGGGDQP